MSSSSTSYANVCKQGRPEPKLQTYVWEFSVAGGYPVTLWALATSKELARKRIISQLFSLYTKDDDKTVLDSDFIIDHGAFAPNLCENGVLIPEVVTALNEEPFIRSAVSGGISIGYDG